MRRTDFKFVLMIALLIAFMSLADRSLAEGFHYLGTTFMAEDDTVLNIQSVFGERARVISVYADSTDFKIFITEDLYTEDGETLLSAVLGAAVQDSLASLGHHVPWSGKTYHGNFTYIFKYATTDTIWVDASEGIGVP